MRALKALVGVMLAGALAIGCGDDGTMEQPDQGVTVRPDMSAEPNLDLGSPPDLETACATNPMTHVEIINACTTAQSYDKKPFYPSKAPNGMLPALP